jgi:cytidyltransferase-like protein
MNAISAIYPGSFDPLTNGHLDLVERSTRLVDRLVIAILKNDQKEALFTVDERIEMVREVAGGIPHVEIAAFDGRCVFVFVFIEPSYFFHRYPATRMCTSRFMALRLALVRFAFSFFRYAVSKKSGNRSLW